MNEPTVEAAYAFLRGHTTADIRFDEHLRPIQYVIAPDGRMVASVMVAMLQSMDTVLFIPECNEDAMEVSATLLQIEEDGPEGMLCDRWQIHHGDPPDVRWAVISIDAARYDGMVIDGEALMRPNPLVDVEATLCREVNAGRLDALRNAAERVTGVDVPDPRLVAVDPGGLDVRARFGVLRVPFPPAEAGAEPVGATEMDGDWARGMIERVLDADDPS